MNLEIYKAEILRRSEERIKNRKKIRSRVLALCVPLALCLTAVLLIPPKFESKDPAQKETVADVGSFSSDSIFCSYVQAQLYVGDEVVIVTDKLTVDKLFIIAAFTEEDTEHYYGRLPMESESATEPESATEAMADQGFMSGRAEESKGHIILFTTTEGYARIYALTKEQYEDILEVLE